MNQRLVCSARPTCVENGIQIDRPIKRTIDGCEVGRCVGSAKIVEFFLISIGRRERCAEAALDRPSIPDRQSVDGSRACEEVGITSGLKEFVACVRIPSARRGIKVQEEITLLIKIPNQVSLSAPIASVKIFASKADIGRAVIAPCSSHSPAEVLHRSDSRVVVASHRLSFGETCGLIVDRKNVVIVSELSRQDSNLFLPITCLLRSSIGNLEENVENILFLNEIIKHNLRRRWFRSNCSTYCSSWEAAKGVKIVIEHFLL